MGFGKRGSVAGSVYGKRGFGMGGFMVLKPLASALNLTPQTLMSDLRSGQTINTLATAAGTTPAALGTSILSSIQSQFTNAVSSGKMTQAQETSAYSKLEQSINSGAWITQLQKMCQGGGFHQKSGAQPVTP
jgi:hypothetical protein